MKELEDQHRKGKNWCDFDATIECAEFVSIVRKPGDLLTIYDRESHRAGKVYQDKKEGLLFLNI